MTSWRICARSAGDGGNGAPGDGDGSNGEQGGRDEGPGDSGSSESSGGSYSPQDFNAWRAEMRVVGQRLRERFPELPLCACEACARKSTQCRMAVPPPRPGEAPLPCPLCWRRQDQPLPTWGCCCDCDGCAAENPEEIDWDRNGAETEPVATAETDDRTESSSEAEDATLEQCDQTQAGPAATGAAAAPPPPDAGGDRGDRRLDRRRPVPPSPPPWTPEEEEATSVVAASTEQVAGELQALQSATEQAAEQPAKHLVSAVGSGSRDELQALQTAVEQPARNLESDRSRGQRMLDGLRGEREKRWHREHVAALAKASAPMRMAGELQALQTAGEQAAEQPDRYLPSWTAAGELQALQTAGEPAAEQPAAASTEQHAGEAEALPWEPVAEAEAKAKANATAKEPPLKAPPPAMHAPTVPPPPKFKAAPLHLHRRAQDSQDEIVD